MLEEVLSKKYNLSKSFLNEKNKCLFAEAEALSLDIGNINLVFRAMDISEKTFKKGCNELVGGVGGKSLG